MKYVNEAEMDALASLIYAREDNVFWTECEYEAGRFEDELIGRGIVYNAYHDGFSDSPNVKHSFEIENAWQYQEEEWDF